jgi:hypothetical protein
MGKIEIQPLDLNEIISKEASVRLEDTPEGYEEPDDYLDKLIEAKGVMESEYSRVIPISKEGAAYRIVLKMLTEEIDSIKFLRTF